MSAYSLSAREQLQQRGLRGRGRGLLPGALAALLALSLGGTAAAGVSVEEERRAGQSLAAVVEARFGRLDDRKRLQRVEAAAGRLAAAAALPPGSVTLRLLNSADYNALTLPGNLIYVMRGLVDGAQSEDELAAALAHEISHVLLGHTREIVEEARPRRRTTFVVERAGARGALNRQVLPAAEKDPAAEERRSRERELEADRAALPLLIRAGYRPEAILSMLGRVEQTEILRRATASLAAAGSGRAQSGEPASHPEAAARIRQARAALRALASPPRP